MNIQELAQPNGEYEETQEKLKNILHSIDELNEQYHALSIAYARKIGSQILESRLPTDSSCRLPSEEGYQTLQIDYSSKNPNTSKDKDIVAEVIHIKHPYMGAAEETQNVYTIRSVPDGDLYLERHIRNLTESNRMHERIDQIIESRGEEPEFSELEDLALSALNRTMLKVYNREIEGNQRDKQWNLRLAEDSDINVLAELLATAEPIG